jgi:hypothetical protein
MHRFAPAFVPMLAVVGALACSAKSTPPDESAEPVAKAPGAARAGSAAPVTTSLALVQQWSPTHLHIVADHVRVVPVAIGGAARVGEIELFGVSDSEPAPEDDAETKLVGVVGGATGKVLEDDELLRAVSASKPAPKLLAEIALLVIGRDGDVLDAATTPEQRKAKVARPAIADQTFSFWVWTREVPRSLEHATLDLATGKLTLVPPTMPREVAVAHAIATLNGVSVARHASAAQTLGEACSDAKALQALERALENHPRVKTRVAVADELHRCGGPAVDSLINAMEHDRASVVRQASASSLGKIGEPRARASLAKAARGEDANLVWAAKNALGKLH